MKILLTNDDGIYAEGLAHLIDFAKTLGEVTVVAPLVQQSGKSCSIELHKPYEIKAVDLCPGVKAYSVDSTPADCVRFAVLGLKEHYDLVLSGINRGYNVGDDIAYSGTVGAVYEASRQGIPAISLSSDLPSFDGAIGHIAEVFEFIKANDMQKDVEILNVNFPVEPKGICVTRQGHPMYEDDFILVGEDLYKPKLRNNYKDTTDVTVDTDAVNCGYISITPLRRGNTDDGAYERLKGLQK